VIELCVRDLLVKKGISGSGDLNRASLLYVKASAQAKAMHNLLPLLSEEELAIFKRGRNMSGGNVPKSATMSEYRAATGMECLFGYLHVLERTERIKELFTMAFPEEEN
jgi:ribonuclease-3 family protein